MNNSNVYKLFNSNYKDIKDFNIAKIPLDCEKVNLISTIINTINNEFKTKGFQLSSLNNCFEFENLEYFELWFISTKETANDIQLHLAIRLEDGTHSIDALTDYSRKMIQDPVFRPNQEHIVKSNKLFDFFKKVFYTNRK